MQRSGSGRLKSFERVRWYFHVVIMIGALIGVLYLTAQINRGGLSQGLLFLMGVDPSQQPAVGGNNGNIEQAGPTPAERKARIIPPTGSQKQQGQGHP